MDYIKLDHAVIVVKDVATAAQDYERMLGVPPVHLGRPRDDQGYRDAVFQLGQSTIQLCEPTDTSKQAGAAMQATLSRRGEGLHNLALAVTDAAEAGRDAENRGLTVIRSAHSPSFFFHPRIAHGVLIQVLQR